MQENQIFHHVYINNCIGAMIRGIADYFGTDFFDRTQEIVIATYEKGVQHWLQRQKNSGEKMAPKYPYIVFEPEMDFEPDPQAGRFFWGYPNFMGQFASQMFKPAIYEDENLLVAPILNRYKGRFNVNVWCSSIYELIDFRALTFQMFGGQDRIIQPVNIDGYIVLPDELLAYVYENKYNGVSYSLDWVENKSEVVLVKNINQNRMVYPFTVTPWIKMTDCGDGAEKYGGSGDEVSDHRLTISCEWECAIPMHIGLIATKQPNFSSKFMDTLESRSVKISFAVELDYEYSVPFIDPDTGKKISEAKLPSQLMQTFGGRGTTDNSGIEQNLVWSETSNYKDKYNYVITQADYDAIHSEPVQNFIVHLLDDVPDAYNMRVYGKLGPLMRDYHWRLLQPGVVEFVGFQLGSLKVGDNIWFAFYEKET